MTHHLDPRRWRTQGVRIFSSASDASRARRPTDVALFVLAILGLALLDLPAPGPTSIDSAIAGVIAQVPSLFGWFWEISYDLLLGWSILLILLSLFAHRRKRLLLDLVLAAAFALGFSLLTGSIAGTDLTVSLKGIASSGSPAVYLAVRLAIATAVVVAASPHMSRPVRYVGRWILVGGAIASIALGVTYAVGMVAGFIVGVGSAALVHLLVGSPGGRLSQEQIGAALHELGVETAEIHQAPLEPRGVALSQATTPAGRSLVVKTFGRDAWDGQLLASTWSSIWHRGETPRLGAGRLQQVEHEAFVTLLAQRAGVPVMPVVAAGTAAEGDALLVLEADARSLRTLAPEEVEDDLLRGFWSSLTALHALRIAHGRIDDIRLAVRSDGSPVIGDFASAKVAADGGSLAIDEAQLLVVTALAVGVERAIEVAAEALGSGGLAGVLPYLQPAVLDTPTRRAIKEQEWDLKDLRKAAAERTGGEIPALEQVRRVSLGSVAKLLIIGFVVYALFSALANVGLQSLIDEFKNAEIGWLVAALVLTPFVQVPQAFSTMGATLKTVAFLPVLMFEYAVQFIALAVPSSAARIALEIRFFERMGVPAAGAVSIGMIDSFSSFILQMVLILVITISGLASLNLTSSTSSSSGSGPSIDWWWLLVVAGLLVLAGLVVWFVPRFRATLRRFGAVLREKAVDARDALEVLRHPSKLLLLFGGNLVVQVMLAAILGLCLHAFGAKATLAQLILINTFVSLFAGFMPVPGGVGVAEAGYTAGLIAIGVPSAVASSTAIAFRMVTFYLPPLWGGFATGWLKRHSYL